MFLDCDDLRFSLSTHYAIPPVFWTPLCRKSNGFFGSESFYDADGHITGHSTVSLYETLHVLIGLDTWYRFIVKKFDPKQSSYSWSEMSFYTTWTTNFTITFGFDVPEASQIRLHRALASRQQPCDIRDIYASHVVLLDEILAMYDESVWAFRDGVRQIELGRSESSSRKTDYMFLHDFARHVIHSTETLGVALDTVNRILEQQEKLTANVKHKIFQGTKALPQTQQYLHFQRQMLRNLRARSEANQLRLQNEINFAFNIAAQSQSETLLSINQETKDDGAAMSAVALVTLTFLPATFVSALFSTTFFNFSPPNGSQSEAWVVSKDFWIYWSVTIPLTVITMASWFFWRHWQRGDFNRK